MKYRYILSTFCVFGTLSLHAEEKGLGSILQEAGVAKKMLSRPEHTKQSSPKQSRFIFKDEYHSSNLEVKDKTVSDPQKSKSYEYENKPRFKFKFNNGAGNNNFVPGQRSPDMGAPMGGGSMGGVSGGGSIGSGAMGGGQGGGGKR